MIAQNRVGNQKVLITGITGFVGSHLTDYLLDNFGEGLQIHGASNSAHHAHLSDPQKYSKVVFHHLSLEDTPALIELLNEVRPHYIFHLAALSHVGPSISNPAETLNTNLNISLSLFEAVRKAGLVEHTRILNVGSSDQYGFIEPDELPVRETNPFRPGNPYAVSKITQEMLGYQYFRSYRLHIVATRAFNHAGPRQSAELAIGAFARQIALAEARQIEPVIRVGNLEARRDFSDVRDIVRGYWLALAPHLPGYPGCQPGEAYNLCSGRDYGINEMLDRLLSLARVRLEVRSDPGRMRPSDMPCVRGDYTKFRQATGWEPIIPIEQSLSDLLNYWRQEVVRAG